MGLRKYIKKYKDYETKELARRAEKRKKIAPYAELKNKRIPVEKAKKLKLTARGITRSLGNPYKVKFPKQRKILKRIKRRKRRKVKTVIVYKK